MIAFFDDDDGGLLFAREADSAEEAQQGDYTGYPADDPFEKKKSGLTEEN